MEKDCPLNIMRFRLTSSDLRHRERERERGIIKKKGSGLCGLASMARLGLRIESRNLRPSFFDIPED